MAPRPALPACGGDLYQTIVGLVGLVMVIAGGALILEVLFDALIEQVGSSIGDQLRRNQLSDGVAMLLIGVLLMRVTWLRWQSIIAADPIEGKTGLRRVYLYASVVISALVTLVPATLLLRELLLILLGEGSGSLISLLNDLSTPLAVRSVGAVMWWWQWRILRGEIEAVGESAESVMVRRVYYYLLALVALGIVWYGAAETTTALLDWLFGPQGIGDRHSIWVVPLATGLSLLAVGTPVWSYHWRAVQSVAGRDDEPGADERSSGPRRVYLYGIALVSALFILYYLIQVVYRIFLWLAWRSNGRYPVGTDSRGYCPQRHRSHRLGLPRDGDSKRWPNDRTGESRHGFSDGSPRDGCSIPLSRGKASNIG